MRSPLLQLSERYGMDIRFAGIVTTLSGLSSIFLCLTTYPEYQTKIQDELDRVIGRDRVPAISDRDNCVLLEAFSLETLRYITVAPLGPPHMCRTNIEFHGYDIPANSRVSGLLKSSY